MDGIYLAAFFVIAGIAGYILVRGLFFIGRNTRESIAEIRRISLHQVGEIFSPELELEYYFEAEGQGYQGGDFLRIDEFLPPDSFLISRQGDFPVLFTAEVTLTGEEHIETFLLSQRNTVAVEYYRPNPEENRILKPGEAGNTLFQNITIQFPWTR